MHLQGAQRRDEHDRRRIQSRLRAFDVEEFLGAQVEAESRLGDRPIRLMERQPRRQHTVAAVRDVREGTAVDERWRALEGLDQVGPKRFMQQGEHRARPTERTRANGISLRVEADEDAVEPIAQVLEPACQAEDRHHFGGRRDVETSLSRDAPDRAAQTDHDFT